MVDPIRVGVYAPPVGANLDELRAIWSRAETLGFDCLYTFDHVRPSGISTGTACFESTTLLAALAAETRHIRLGPLVLAATYRHPAILASAATTLDHISGGRLELGLGAGGSDDAPSRYGVPFGDVATRMDILEETCVVLRALWTGDPVDHAGQHFRLRGSGLAPQPVQERIPIIIGGSGRRRLLPLAAEHADIWNTFAPGEPDEYRSLVSCLDDHCRRIGRDPGSLRRSLVFRTILGEAPEDAASRFLALTGEADPASARARGWLVVGTPSQLLAALEPYQRLGVGDFILALRAPFDSVTMELVAREVAPELRATTPRGER